MVQQYGVCDDITEKAVAAVRVRRCGGSGPSYTGEGEAEMKCSDSPLQSVARDTSHSTAGDVCQVRCVDHITLEHARQSMKPGTTIDALTETLRVRGDPTCMYIAWVLSQEDLCVCQVANLPGRSQSAVSHSLPRLRRVRYCKTRRAAYYALHDDDIPGLPKKGVRHVEEEP